MLRPQDVLIALRLTLISPSRGSDLAEPLGLSSAEVYAALKRLVTCDLAREDPSSAVPLILRRNLLKFLLHGVRYVYPAVRGELTRGVPTGHAAPPLFTEFVSDSLPPVWPHPLGTVRGYAFAPIYRSAPDAALQDPKLYELLALLDAVRAGTARERGLAASMMEARLSHASVPG
jgi:hypothetical protein